MVGNGMTRITRRINIYGGPGSGKSTLCAYLFGELKMLGFNVEHCTEYIKNWCYLGRNKRSFDEVYIFGKQLHREDVLLQSGVKLLVTDSPIHLQTFYSDLVGHCTVEGQLQMAREFEREYPSFNVLLQREGVPFQPEGRYQKTVKEAKDIDDTLAAFLTRVGVPYVTVPSLDKETLLSVVLKAVEAPPELLAPTLLLPPAVPPVPSQKWYRKLFDWLLD